MSLTTEDVAKIAHLASLELSEDPKHYAEELSQVLGLVEQMSKVNTNDVEPMAHPLDVSQRLREDKVTETNQRDELQKIAPQTEAGLYLVPQVIE